MTSAATRTRLRRDFFARDATVVAAELIGALLVRADDGLLARLVETEAYRADDPACHAYRGRTERNAPLFGPPGHAYVYFTYGMHWCLNVATGRDGVAEGVLLRAAEPLDGLDVMRSRRARDPQRSVRDRELLRGPARLAQAFGLDGAWSGADLCAGTASPLHLATDDTMLDVEVTPRVGVAQAPDYPWRYVAAGSRWASPYKRSPRAG